MPFMLGDLAGAELDRTNVSCSVRRAKALAPSGCEPRPANCRSSRKPWIRIPSLASHLLACLQRQLPDDWQQRYRLRPVLLETFCETPRFEGTCYRAANWIHLGQTQGRGKLDTRHEYNQPRDAALRRHLLSRRQLDPSRPDARPRQARYAARVQPASQKRLRQTPLPGLEANPQPLVPQPYFTARSNAYGVQP